MLNSTPDNDNATRRECVNLKLLHDITKRFPGMTVGELHRMGPRATALLTTRAGQA